VKRRVVVTGLGVVAPNGIGKQAFWSACLHGRSGVGPIRDPVPILYAARMLFLNTVKYLAV
jgi:3-oxoacyl-(acyl-carrier-protein) synthase